MFAAGPEINYNKSNLKKKTLSHCEHCCFRLNASSQYSFQNSARLTDHATFFVDERTSAN